MRYVALLLKALAMAFFILLRLIWLLLIKGLLMDCLLGLYRLWRAVKKILRRATSPENERQRTWFASGFMALVSILIVISNVQASSSVREFGNQSLMARLLDPVPELSVIEAAEEGELISLVASSAQPLLAALEISQADVDPGDSPSTSTKSNIFTSIANISGALVNLGSGEADSSRRGIIIHTVAPGENASSIAYRHGLKSSTVLWANNLNPHSTIRPGDDLKIPAFDGVLHTVKKNETLSGLAQKYEIEVDKIMDANALVSANQLSIGDELIIPGAEIAAPVATTRLARVRQIFNPNPVKVADSDFLWPIAGSHRRITQYYWLGHRAIDLGGSSSMSIIASKAGRVAFAGWADGYGYNVLLDHGGGVQTRYGHLSRLFVKAGDQVAQGEELGLMGTTGRSTGVHLHFEIKRNNSFLNPLSYL